MLQLCYEMSYHYYHHHIYYYADNNDDCNDDDDDDYIVVGVGVTVICTCMHACCACLNVWLSVRVYQSIAL